MFDFSTLEQNIQETKEWLTREYAAVRTGRATPAILDGVRVESYGSKMPVNHVANITVEDAKTIRVTPWDTSIIKSLESAINDADIGVSVVTDGEGLRVIFPELTAERRDMLAKTVHRKLEDARISIRQARDEVWSEIQKQEKEGTISENDKFKSKEQMEKKIKEANEELEAMAKKKEQELRS